jgi:hypothetical protein
VSKDTIANVYVLRHSDGYESLLPVVGEDCLLFIFDRSPRASSWKPVKMRRVKFTRRGQFQKPCDFPLCPGELSMTQAAKEKIGPYLEKYGEFLPLECDEGKFWTFHVTRCVDALDEGASDVIRSPDDPNVVLMIQKHVFQPSKLTSDWMFRLPQARGRGEPYVTDSFVNLIHHFGLTGLEFKRVWPHS